MKSETIKNFTSSTQGLWKRARGSTKGLSRLTGSKGGDAAGAAADPDDTEAGEDADQGAASEGGESDWETTDGELEAADDDYAAPPLAVQEQSA